MHLSSSGIKYSKWLKASGSSTNNTKAHRVRLKIEKGMLRNTNNLIKLNKKEKTEKR